MELMSLLDANKLSFALKHVSYDDHLKSKIETKLRDAVPKEWKFNISLFLIHTMSRETEKLIDDDMMNNTWDRFGIAGANTFTWDFVRPLAMLARSYDFSECYRPKNADGSVGEGVSLEILTAFERFEKRTAESGRYEGLSDQYNWDLSEEVLSMFDYEPTPEHNERLYLLSLSIGCPLDVLRVNDFDVRSRKRLPYGHPRCIASDEGVEYLHFTIKVGDFYDHKFTTEVLKNSLAGGPKIQVEVFTSWIPVGFRCALKSCGCNAPPLHCSGCGVARYCSVDHQKQDWSRHKEFCKKNRS